MQRFCKNVLVAALFMIAFAAPGRGACPDFDADGDVDSVDFYALAVSLVGPGESARLAEDLDADADVDLVDFARLQQCFAGSGSPAAPGCDCRDVYVSDGVLIVNDSDVGTAIALRLAPGSPDFLQVDIGDDGAAEYAFARAEFAAIVVLGNGGGDTLRIDQINGPFTDTEATEINGGAGDDVIIGGVGAEMLIGGSGDDVVDGGPGNDVAHLGAGDDTFRWEPGDGSDTVEGQEDSDTLAFIGSNSAEVFDLSAVGNRLRLFRSVGNVSMSVAGVEDVRIETRGGIDSIIVASLAATDLYGVTIDLADATGAGDGVADTIAILGKPIAEEFIASAVPGGALEVDDGDTRVRIGRGESVRDVVLINGNAGDSVRFEGTDAADTINVISTPTAGVARITCSSISVSLDVSNVSTLSLNGLVGNDLITATGNLAGMPMQIVFDGGPDGDTILGSNGSDLIFGGDGDDDIDGNQGNDVVLMGAGDDVFRWEPGDGSDTVEGGSDTDALAFSGSSASEVISVSRNGARVLFTRNVANIAMDLADVESVQYNALGGTDTVNINDLTGTVVSEVIVNLAGSNGLGDASADQVICAGTAGDDTVIVSGGNGLVSAIGLAATILLTGCEPANDQIRFNLFAGDDVIDAADLAATSVRLTADGGEDDDVLVGSAGVDTLLGGGGDDVLIGGPGADVLDGGTGSNVVIQD